MTDRFPEAPVVYWRMRVPLCQVVLWTVTCALVAVLLASAWRLRHPAVIPVRTVAGVTFAGDACYVNDAGALLCQGGRG